MDQQVSDLLSPSVLDAIWWLIYDQAICGVIINRAEKRKTAHIGCNARSIFFVSSFMYFVFCTIVSPFRTILTLVAHTTRIRGHDDVSEQDERDERMKKLKTDENPSRIP